MKILMLTSDLSISGISTSIIDAASRLKKSGMDVVCASSGGDFVRMLESARITHYHVPMGTRNALNPKVLFAVAKLSEIIWRERVDLVHAHTRVAQIAAQLVSVITRVPFISTDHTFHRKHFLRRVFPCWGKRVIAVSQPVREALVNDLGVTKSRVTCIPNGVDTDRFGPVDEEERESMRQMYGISETDIVVGSVSRIVETKGYQYLLHAMPNVLSACPDVSLLLVGDGDYRVELARKIERMGLRARVHFAGFETDIRLVMGLIDIFVLPSTSGEGLGLSVLEAMACGKPVVASNVGGLYTLVKDGINGFLVPPGDAAALADALDRLIGDDELRAQMGKAGRRMAEEQFSLDRVVERYRDTYEEVLLSHAG